ncbi:flagellar hook-length control protein FliK [Lentibacillus saliphilus]|uniref:flagellar hook-length control protein FliK n=1 Tax=Lentibacillus saliphilus TaxID=2737028 RepID=UPI001C2F4C1A|nr:flagellar hook-length control protein FliK [Lentibacillus saliphilus]
MSDVHAIKQSMPDAVTPFVKKMTKQSDSLLSFQQLLAVIQPVQTGTESETVHGEQDVHKALESGDQELMLSELVDMVNGVPIAEMMHSEPIKGFNRESLLQMSQSNGVDMLSMTAKVDVEGKGNHHAIESIKKEAMAILATFLTKTDQEAPKLDGLKDQQSVHQAAIKLLKLLEHYQQLTKQANLGATGQTGQSVQQSSDNTGSQLGAIWDELVQTYEKRMQLASKHHYNVHATVSSSDISKWLKGVLIQSTSLNGQEQLAAQNVSTTTMPMSRVEQYVIHMTQNVDTNQSNKPVMEQFQKAIQSSRFLAQNNGPMTLNFALRPEHLGDMTVRLAQINGELTVKILVSTGAAKEMMEKNIHQLKHMFSPHQVVIERQEMQVNANQGLYADQDDHQSHDHDEQSQQSDQDQSNHHDGDRFKEALDDILNQKV